MFKNVPKRQDSPSRRPLVRRAERGLCGEPEIAQVVERSTFFERVGQHFAIWLSVLGLFAGSASAAPVINFNASPTTIAGGGTTTLTWTVTGATSCTATSVEDPSWTVA